MNRNTRTISRDKFSKLSARRQHELIVDLGKECLEKKEFSFFKGRYGEFLAWGCIDRYMPPAWLNDEEALHEFIAFHNYFSLQKSEIIDNTSAENVVSWQGRFNVQVVLDQVRSPYNVGSVLRLIDNYGFRGLVHSTPWLNPGHPQLKRAARGCQNWIPVDYLSDLDFYLKESDIPVIGIEDDASAVPLKEWSPPSECILVLGNETYGIALNLRRLCGQIVKIPVYGYKKSMNVHHAFAVAAQRFVDLHDV